jgi:arginyl-tRNA--protein-N-Asp/Glu arginylyltransferase
MNFLYLGYWVKDSPKMAYKRNFKPLEILMEQQWRLLTDEQ